MFDQPAVFRGESRWKVAVDIKFANHLPTYKDRYHNFRFGFERARQIARVLAYVIDHNRLAGGRSGSTNSLVEWDTGVRRLAPWKAPKTRVSAPSNI